MTQGILNDISSHLTRLPMAESTFGRLAVNDGKLIARLRNGGRCWPETEKQIRSFMKKREKKAKAGQVTE